MSRPLAKPWLAPLILALAASGCGKDPFGPPARPKPTSPADGPSESRPAFVVFLVPAVPEGDLEVWGARALHEANDKRAILRIMGPAPGESPDLQPSIVARAIAEGATALIVYPGESLELPRALADAEAKGVPVVLLAKGLAAPPGSKPFTLVEPAPFDESARQVVSTVVEDLKRASKPSDGTAIVLEDKATDATSSRRVAALKAAAEAAKFRKVLTIPFDSSAVNSAALAVIQAVEANPDTSAVLADDSEAMDGASVARKHFGGKPPFLVGGYTDYRTSQVLSPPNEESCYVQGRYEEIGGLAVLTALAKLRGDRVDDHAYVTSKFTKGQGTIATQVDRTNTLPVSKLSEGVKPEGKKKPIPGRGGR